MHRILSSLILISLLFITSTWGESPIDRCYESFNSEIVSRVQIENWLNQFDVDDRPTALSLLQQIQYYTYPRLMGDLTLLHGKLLTRLHADGFIHDPENELAFDKVDFSKAFVAKSGDLLSYFYRSSNKIRAVNFKNLGDLCLDPADKDDRALVILEDYVGSGIQFLIEVYAHRHAELFNQYRKIYFVPLVINSRAIKRIVKVQQGDVDSAAYDFITFVNLQDEAIKETVLKEVRTIAPEKLELVYLHEETPLNDPQRHPETSRAIQSLINKYTHNSYFGGNFASYGHTVFFYNCPNNLPEILWDTKATKADGSPWYPLFRRVEDLSIYRIAEFIPLENQVW